MTKKIELILSIMLSKDELEWNLLDMFDKSDIKDTLDYYFSDYVSNNVGNIILYHYDDSIQSMRLIFIMNYRFKYQNNGISIYLSYFSGYKPLEDSLRGDRMWRFNEIVSSDDAIELYVKLKDLMYKEILNKYGKP